MNVEQYIEKFQVHETLTEKNFSEIFSEIIKNAENFAIGPFFYFMPSYVDHKMRQISENITDMTPFSREEWLSKDFTFFSSAFHPDDLEYIVAAAAFTKDVYLNTDKLFRDKLRFNLYSRYKNKNEEYRWVLIQSWFYINSFNEIESVLYIFYDLSHLQITNMPLLSVIDFNNEEVQYYKHFEQKINKIDFQIPQITKREKEVLRLMAEGYTTPQISEKLFISYHTVQNHKKNLRRKTDTTTSSELIAFVIKYNILWI